jgi:hypothetical protein
VTLTFTNEGTAARIFELDVSSGATEDVTGVYTLSANVAAPVAMMAPASARRFSPSFQWRPSAARRASLKRLPK